MTAKFILWALGKVCLYHGDTVSKLRRKKNERVSNLTYTLLRTVCILNKTFHDFFLRASASPYSYPMGGAQDAWLTHDLDLTFMMLSHFEYRLIKLYF